MIACGAGLAGLVGWQEPAREPLCGAGFLGVFDGYKDMRKHAIIYGKSDQKNSYDCVELKMKFTSLCLLSALQAASALNLGEGYEHPIEGIVPKLVFDLIQKKLMIS